MPEGVEVRKYADFIKHYLLNKRVTQIVIQAGRYKKHGAPTNFKKIVKELPLIVKKVSAKGKLLWIEFSNGDIVSITLGLSGGFVFITNAQKVIHPKIFDDVDDNNYNDNNNDNKTEVTYDIIKFKNTSGKHLNIGFKINTGTMYFYDVMSFGTMTIYTNTDEFIKKLNSLGPDIMNPNTSFEEFKEKIMSSNNLNKKIGNVLMNQKIVSGIGNYLRAEILWLARISPFRYVKNLKNVELRKIFKIARHVMWSDYNIKKGIKLGLVDPKIKSHKDYGLMFLIYKQKYDPLGNKVSTALLHDGTPKRVIHYVKKLQK